MGHRMPRHVDTDVNSKLCGGLVQWAKWRLTSIVPGQEVLSACPGSRNNVGGSEEGRFRADLNRWISTCSAILQANQNTRSRPSAPSQQAAIQAPAASNAGMSNSASCSDITGTEGGPSAPCVRIPGWTPIEPFNHARTPARVRVVRDGKVVELSVPGLEVGKFGLWLDDGVLSIRSWNDKPAPSHVDVDGNRCPGHTAWRGWTEPRCEELAQKEAVSAAEISARAESVTAGRCQSQGGVIFNPNEGAITEAACLSIGGNVLTPIDNESRGWCPTTRGCWDKLKWTKIIESDASPRCKMKYGSHETDCRAVRDQ